MLRLFEDEKLAQRLSRNAREAALVRHDPATVRQTLLDIYAEVLVNAAEAASVKRREGEAV